VATFPLGKHRVMSLYYECRKACGRCIRERDAYLIVVTKYEVHLKLEQVEDDKSELNYSA